MSDIPTSVFEEIIIRVPADFLARSRCVCKLWRLLIDDTVFLKSHLRSQMDGENILIRKKSFFIGKLFSLPLSSLDYDSQTREKTIYAANITNLVRPNVPVVTHLPVVSCQRFILLFDYGVKKTWTIWNPFTGYFLEIPHYNELTKGVRQLHVGFGYDEISGDYKVVKISHRLSQPFIETLIVSVKLGTWKKIDDYPDYVGPLVSIRGTGAFVKGAVHWFKYLKEGGGNEVLMIIALDLATEKYRDIPMPNDLVSSNGKYLVEKYLDGLGGYLLFSCCYDGRFDVWELEDGLEESGMWHKLVSLEEVNSIQSRVVSYIKSKKQVVVQNGNCFLWFDVGKSCEESNTSCLMWKVTVMGVGWVLGVIF